MSTPDRTAADTAERAARQSYGRLVALLAASTGDLAPTLGAQVAAASVAGRLHGPDAGLERLDRLLDGPGVARFQPWWAVRAHLLAAAGRNAEAGAAYDRALALSDDEAVRTYLAGRRLSLAPSGHLR